MLPATATFICARRKSAAVKEVTVVFPLVPVTASTLGEYPHFALSSFRPKANSVSSVPVERPFD